MDSSSRRLERRRVTRQLLPWTCFCSFQVQGSEGTLPQEGEGELFDLSIMGCRFSTDSRIIVGEDVALILLLMDGRKPLHVGHAEVRWVKNGFVGLVFRHIPPGDESQLSESLQLFAAR